MEIELNQSEYEVKKSWVIPSILQKLYLFTNKYGGMYSITVLCLIGFLGVNMVIGPIASMYWGALVIGGDRFDFFRCVTSMFLHGGFVHILINLLSLSAISKQLSFIWTKTQVFILFFLSGFLANILGYIFYSTMNIKVAAVGASGGLFGLLGTLLAFFQFHRGLSSQQKAFYIRQMTPILVLNLLLGLFIPNIALMVHVFGFLIGFILGFLFEKVIYNLVHTRPFFWTCTWVIIIIYIISCFILATFNYWNIVSSLPVY